MHRWSWILLAFSLSACSSPPKPDIEQPDPPDKVDPAKQMVSDLAGLHFDRLGNPVLRWDHLPPVRATRERPHKLLVLLVEYQDRGFDRFKGEPDQARKLVDWYQRHLFDDNYQKVDTLSHYYRTQSLGAYHVTGQVLPPIKLSKERRAYGSPHRPAGGDWRNDADPQGLVVEALSQAQKSQPNLDWGDFDRWDPQDFDGDKVLDEGDGYIDHFVLVFAGGGQASCEGLQKLREVLTPNVGMEALETLDERQRECGDRIWPHRYTVKSNDGLGPAVSGTDNPLGGVPLSKSLWVRDYNMQSEYVGPSTFIHEFGHSVGLPDVYARTSSNSTGSWEAMSGTTSPSPQNLSAWSRLMLGWLQPEIITPPQHGGQADQVVHLRTLDDPASATGANRAAMIILPPKTRTISLTRIPPAWGKWALYSGQGNELDRTAELTLDLTKAEESVEFSFDAWWEIEAGWDFAYVEARTGKGQPWTRLLPKDRRHMPAKHGHDGKKTLPGFTGLSGDFDGDGKNERNPACDPKKEIAHGEDAVAAEQNPCLEPRWLRPAFDLSAMRGKQVSVRIRYVTDGAAVMRGILIDNVRVTGLPGVTVDGDFEDDDHPGWKLDGFSRSSGLHELLVPHYYLVEYRDPYASAAGGEYRYDQSLARPSYGFYGHGKSDQMMAVAVRKRPGVVVWYYDGAFAWSENDPAINGAGKGYLLALDSNPNELKLPGLDYWFAGDDGNFDTHYDVSSELAQQALRAAYTRTVCTVRSPDYMPRSGIDEAVAKAIGCGKGPAPVSSMSVDGKPMRYVYETINEFLPGPERDALFPVGELLDTRMRKGKLMYRLRDRSLRSYHTFDNPLSLEPYADGVTLFRVVDGKLEKVSSRPHPAQASFTDSTPARWKNPKLPFGGVEVPKHGLTLTLQPVAEGAPAGTRASVQVSWQAATGATD